jgi:hypothetical protein
MRADRLLWLIDELAYLGETVGHWADHSGKGDRCGWCEAQGYYENAPELKDGSVCPVRLIRGVIEDFRLGSKRPETLSKGDRLRLEADLIDLRARARERFDQWHAREGEPVGSSRLGGGDDRD